MNKDIVNGNWTQIKGQIKTKWAQLTDNDINAFEGKLETIAGKLQESYGYAKEAAEKEYNEFKASLNA